MKAGSDFDCLLIFLIRDDFRLKFFLVFTINTIEILYLWKRGEPYVRYKPYLWSGLRDGY
jgi:hypothetical protein